MARDSFIFYRSFYEAIKEIPEENQLQVYRAITNYALNQEEIELDGISKAIFSLVKPQLDANFKKYENGKQKKSKKEANDKQKESKSETNVNVNENVNVNVNENENVNDNVEEVKEELLDSRVGEVIEFYNNNIAPATPYVFQVFDDYLKKFDKDLIIFAIQKAIDSNAKNIKYIKGILNNWSKKGIKSLLEAKQEEMEFKNSKQEKDKGNPFFNLLRGEGKM